MLRFVFMRFAMPIFMIVTSLLFHRGMTAWGLVNVVAYPIIVALSIAAHEGGHALTAWILGMRVPRIDLGMGREIVRFRWKGTQLRLHALLMMGMTYLGAKRQEGARWRLWLAVLAGPLVTLALTSFAGTAVFRTWAPLLWPAGAVAHRLALLEMLAFSNFWLLFSSVLPFPNSDGTKLLTIPFMPARQLEHLLLMPALVETDDRIDAEDFAGAQRTLDAALTRVPGSWLLRSSVAALRIHEGRRSEARALLLELLAEKPPEPGFGFLARNNLAWCDFLLRADDLRAEADEHSKAAYDHARVLPHFMGTRAAVLGWLGRHDEAVALGKKAFARHSRPRDRALVACVLALSYVALGRLDDADTWVTRARACDPRCPLLEEAETAVYGPRPTFLSRSS